MSRSPGPFRWKANLGPLELPVLLDADGNVVCDFGNAGQYYPTEGTPPSESNAELLRASAEALALLLAYDAVETELEARAWRAAKKVLVARIDGAGKP